MSLIVVEPKKDKLGPEQLVPAREGSKGPNAAPARPAPLADLAPVRTGKLSRLDTEIEALRRSPTPTQNAGQDDGAPRRTNPFLTNLAAAG